MNQIYIHPKRKTKVVFVQLGSPSEPTTKALRKCLFSSTDFHLLFCVIATICFAALCRKEGFQKNGKKTRLLPLMGGMGLECNKNFFIFFNKKTFYTLVTGTLSDT